MKTNADCLQLQDKSGVQKKTRPFTLKRRRIVHKYYNNIILPVCSLKIIKPNYPFCSITRKDQAELLEKTNTY